MPAKRPAKPVKIPVGQKAARARKTVAKPITTPALSKKKASRSLRKVPSAIIGAEPQPDCLTDLYVSAQIAELVAGDDDDAAQAVIAKARQREAIRNSKRSATARLEDPPPAPVTTLLTRVSRAIERELSQIEIIVGGQRVKPAQRTEAERRARTLASLARTLREVMQLRAGEEKTKRDDDAVPRDLNELRAELARRLDRLVGDAKAIHPDEAG